MSVTEANIAQRLARLETEVAGRLSSLEAQVAGLRDDLRSGVAQDRLDLVRYQQQHDDHEQRIRKNEKDIAKLLERLGLLVAAMGVLQVIGIAVATWIGLR